MTSGHAQKIAGPPTPNADGLVRERSGRDADVAERDREVRQEPERALQLGLDPERAQVRVVSRCDVLGLGRTRHDLLLLPPHPWCETDLWGVHPRGTPGNGSSFGIPPVPDGNLRARIALGFRASTVVFVGRTPRAAGIRRAALRVEAVEPELLVLRGQDGRSREAGVVGHRRERVGSEHGARPTRGLVIEPARQAAARRCRRSSVRSMASPGAVKTSAVRSSATRTAPPGASRRRAAARTSTGRAMSWTASKIVTRSYRPAPSAARRRPRSGRRPGPRRRRRRRWPRRARSSPRRRRCRRHGRPGSGERSRCDDQPVPHAMSATRAVPSRRRAAMSGRSPIQSATRCSNWGRLAASCDSMTSAP